MNKLIKDILTGKDCQTFDLGRILWAAGCIMFFILSIVHVIINHAFAPLEYGASLGAILAGGAGGLALKAKTEPENDNPKS